MYVWSLSSLIVQQIDRSNVSRPFRNEKLRIVAWRIHRPFAGSLVVSQLAETQIARPFRKTELKNRYLQRYKLRRAMRACVCTCALRKYTFVRSYLEPRHASA